MLETGNYIVPTFNARLRVDKPVLMYWLQVAAIKAFGINEFAVRFPSALAALLTLFILYELGQTLFGRATALLGSLILASTALMMGAARFANPDAVLNLFIGCTLTVFWLGHRGPTSLWFLGMGLLLGLAVLTKGPIGIVMPALVALVYLFWENKLALLWDRRAWHLALALGVVALPWYIWVAVETRGTFLQGFFWDHNLSRFIQPMDAHNGSPFYYLVVLLVGMAPWSLVLLFGVWYGWWSTMTAPCPHHRYAAWWQTAVEPQTANSPGVISAYRFLFAWLACYVLFFSMSATKLPNYMLPAALPFALLTARFLDRWRLGELKPPRWVMLTCLAYMASVGVATGVGLVVVSGQVSLRPLGGPALVGVQYWAFFGLVPVITALIAWRALRSSFANAVVTCMVLGTFLFLGPLVGGVLAAWNGIKAPQPLVEEIGNLARDRDIRIGGYGLEHLPSLNFYARRDVLHCQKEEETLAFLRYQVPVYLFVPERIWNSIREKAPSSCRLVARHSDLYHRNDVVVVSNFP